MALDKLRETEGGEEESLQCHSIFSSQQTPYRKMENEIWCKLRFENVTSLLAVLVYSPTGSASQPKCLQVMPLMSG